MRVMIVDDELLVADYLDNILRKFNHEVVGISSTLSQAQKQIHVSNPDLVLLDITLSNSESGIDLAELLNKKKIPFIYISANNDGTTLKKAWATKPICYLTKPFYEKDIVAALKLLP